MIFTGIQQLNLVFDPLGTPLLHAERSNLLEQPACHQINPVRQLDIGIIAVELLLHLIFSNNRPALEHQRLELHAFVLQQIHITADGIQKSH
ncbi:hypothetical protein D3C87_2028050 [compost metagenome]